jgi:thiol-disulfide isomerase/thioredoxin
MQTIMALLFALLPVVYPQLPDVSTVFKQASSIAAKYRTLQYSAETTVQMTSDVVPAIKTTTKSMVYRLNPGKLRMESTGFTMVSDGDNIWTYSAVSKQYTKTAAALGPMTAFGAANMPNMADLQKAAAVASKVVGEETVEVEGKARPSWIVETRLDNLPIPVPNAQPVTLAGTVIKMWLDKELGLTLRMTMSMKMSMPAVASPMQMEMEERVTGLSIDQPLADPLFTFVPPPDAKEVTSLFPVGLPGTPGIPNRVDLSGKDAQVFDVKALNGTPYSLSSLKGKPILLDFWASWCGPCKQAIPALENLNRDYKDLGLVILGIDVGEDRGTVETFLKTTPASYPIVLGIDSDIQSQYQVSVYPTYVLIDSAGKIVAHQMGFTGETNLRNLLTKAGLIVAISPAAAPPR